MLKNNSSSKWLFPVKGEVNSILLSHSLLKASVPSLPIFLTQYQIDGLNISDKTVSGTQRCGRSAPLLEAVFPFVQPALCALCGGRSSLSVGNVNVMCRRGAAARTDSQSHTCVPGQSTLSCARRDSGLGADFAARCQLPGAARLGKPFLPEDTRVQSSGWAGRAERGRKGFPLSPARVPRCIVTF